MFLVTLFFSAVLFYYDARVHRDTRYSFLCAVAGFYLVGQLFIEQTIYWLFDPDEDYLGNVVYYSVFSVYVMGVTIYMAMQRAHWITLSTLIAAAFILYVPQIFWMNHPFFWGWYNVHYAVLNAALVISLTILPDKFPNYFDVLNDKDRDSFISFFVPVLFKNLVNFVLRPRIH